jgi:hypothetical protein
MLTFKVVPENGTPFTVKATTRDVLVWEKTTRGRTFADLLREPNLVDYYAIAWRAAWRQKLFTGTLKDFEDSHDIDLDDSEDVVDPEPDPTLPVPYTEPSLPLPSEQE